MMESTGIPHTTYLERDLALFTNFMRSSPNGQNILETTQQSFAIAPDKQSIPLVPT